MHMRENMILTEAVVPGALAAIAELQIRIVCVRATADSAFMVVGRILLLLLRLVYRPPEIHGPRRVAVLSPPAHIVNIGRGKQGEVQ